MDGGPAVVCVGYFSCGVMNVDFGGVSGRLLGQGVRLLIARDARVRSDFVEVGGGSMADPAAEKHLQGLKEGQVFGFQYGLWFIDKSIEKVKTA